MFSLDRQAAKISNINVREEKHGDEDVLAADITLHLKQSNDFLSQLHATLKWSLYGKPELADLLPSDNDHLPTLRYPLLDTLKWTGNIVGGHFQVHLPISKNDMPFSCDTKDLKLDCEKGGTVAVSFKVQIKPTPDQVGRITALLGKTVDISIQPPKADPIE